MRDIADAVRTWLDTGDAFALAVVTDVEGSAPRPVGTTMAVTTDGDMVGNVSAGCVESAVVERALAVMGGAAAPGVVEFGISDDEAFGVGLACGGRIGVLIFVPRDDDRRVWLEALDRLDNDERIALCLVLSGASVGALRIVDPTTSAGTLGDDGLETAVTADARSLLALGETDVARYGRSGEREQDGVAILVQSHVPPARLLIFGATDYAAPLARIGGLLGYRVAVCDARATFATRERFPTADEVIVQWPHRYLETLEVDNRTVVCVLTHDPKFDVPLLVAALRTPAAYIGVMGSRASQSDRLERLRTGGVDDDAIARLRAPIGLDLGARTPAETAVSIAAEIIATRWSGSGLPLRDTGGPIHPRELSR